MDWQIIVEYIRPELLILVPVLWWLGWLMKNSKKFQDWIIPIVITVIGVVLGPLWIAIVLAEGFSSAVVLYGMVQGVLVSAFAVLGNEIFKQVTKKRFEDGE